MKSTKKLSKASTASSTFKLFLQMHESIDPSLRDISTRISSFEHLLMRFLCQARRTRQKDIKTEHWKTSLTIDRHNFRLHCQKKTILEGLMQLPN